MTPDGLQRNTLLRGSVFPELVKVIAVVPVGDSFKLICEGMTSGKVITARMKAKTEMWR